MRNHHHHSVSSFYQTGRWIDLNILLSVIIILIIISPGRVDGLDHSNNWAVLICTSRFWFNYRHVANTLGMYRSVKRLGIPDSNIILMLADDMACNPRNMFPGTVYSNADRKLDLYGDQIEVDYRGDEVSVENFIRLLTGRVAEGTPRSKRLMTDERSNVLVYMTGHGGEEFLKFQDSEEISAFDLADAFQTMWAKNRYNQLLFMIDTCQANTMLTKFYSPNIIATGSSAKGENSYSHHADSDIGVAVVDRFSHFVLSYLENMNKTSQLTMQDFVNSYSYEECHSTPEARTDLMERPLREILMTDFFGGVSTVEVSDSTLRLKIEEEEKKMDPQFSKWTGRVDWIGSTDRSDGEGQRRGTKDEKVVKKLMGGFGGEEHQRLVAGCLLILFVFASQLFASRL